jgi:hypothetical protein
LSKKDCDSLRRQCEQGLWIQRNLEPIIIALTSGLPGLFTGFITKEWLLAIVIQAALNLLPQISSLECTTLFGDKYASDYVNNLRQDHKSIKDWMHKNRKSSGCDDYVAQCGQQQVSGGQAGDTRTIQLTAKKEKLMFPTKCLMLLTINS